MTAAPEGGEAPRWSRGGEARGESDDGHGHWGLRDSRCAGHQFSRCAGNEKDGALQIKKGNLLIA